VIFFIFFIFVEIVAFMVYTLYINKNMVRLLVMKLETRKKIAAIVKSWIDNSEFTQTDLAKKFGISRITFSAQINGRKSFPMERIRDLIELLNPITKDIDDIQQLMAADARGALGRVSPLTRVGLKVEEERAHYGISDTPNIEKLKAEHRAEILQLKLDHAEREKELLEEVVKQLKEKK
jgi:predicted XRE-type DNA-binding protein